MRVDGDSAALRKQDRETLADLIRVAIRGAKAERDDVLTDALISILEFMDSEAVTRKLAASGAQSLLQ
jgi:DNA-binding protein YbaB